MRKWPLLLLLGALEAAAPARARGDSRGPVISLPPLLVETKGGPRWRYGEAPGLQVLSCCEDETSRDFVARNLRQQDLLNELLAPDLQMRTSAPLVLILYDQRNQAALSQEVAEEMNRMAPHEPGGSLHAPAVALVPHLRLSDPDSTEIYLILQDSEDSFLRANLSRRYWDGTVAAPSGYDELTFSGDYVAMLLDGRTPELPPWFRAGLMQLYQGVSFSGSEITVQPFEWISAPDQEFLAQTLVYAGGFLPPGELFSPSLLPSAAAEPLPVLARSWQTEAALFIRWALDGRGHPRREALWRFVRESSAAPATEEMFRRCFGLGYAQLAEELVQYLPEAARQMKWTAPDPPPRPRLDLQDATPAQIRQAKGDWGRRVLGIIAREHPELLPGEVARARQTLLEAYAQGDRSPDLLTSIGQLYFQSGDRFQARAYLESAVQAGATRPMPYVQLAQLRLLNALGQHESRLGRAELGSVLAPLAAARRLEPPLAAGYLLLAAAWRHSASPPTAADLVPLNEGARLFHRNPQLVLAAAALDVNAADRRSADGLVSLALGSAPDPGFRQALLAFQAAYLAPPGPPRN